MNEKAPKLQTLDAANENRAPRSPEALRESIEQAQELLAELMVYDRVDMYGGEAMDAINETRALSGQLTEILKGIPAKNCLENGLPYHPSHEKYDQPSTEFPDSADSGYAHVLGYEHKPVESNYPDRFPRADELTEVA